MPFQLFAILVSRSYYSKPGDESVRFTNKLQFGNLMLCLTSEQLLLDLLVRNCIMPGRFSVVFPLLLLCLMYWRQLRLTDAVSLTGYPAWWTTTNKCFRSEVDVWICNYKGSVKCYLNKCPLVCGLYTLLGLCLWNVILRASNVNLTQLWILLNSVTLRCHSGIP